MSLEISFDKLSDPFAKPYEACTKCGGRQALRVESKSDGGTRTSQVCKKCGAQNVTSVVNVVRVEK